MRKLAEYRINLKDYVSGSLKNINANFRKSSMAARTFERDTNKSVSKTKGGFSNLNNVGKMLGARGGMSAFSGATRLAAGGMNPLIAGLALAGAAAFKLGAMFVKSSAELRKNVQMTNQLLGGTEKETKAVTAQATALTKVYGGDYKETIQAASKLSQQFGITTKQSLKLIEQGFASGGNLSGDMLQSIDDSARSFKNLGATGSQQMAILQQSVSKGIKDTPKLLESFNENLPNLGGDVTRLLDQNFGQGFSKQLKGNLAEGKTTAIEALQSISTAVGQTNLGTGAAESLAEQIFGDKSDSAVQLLQDFAQFDTNLDNLVSKNEDFNSSKSKQLAIQEKIAAAELKSSKRIEKLTERFSGYALQAKLYLADNLEGILDFVDGLGKAVSWVSKIHDYISKIPILGNLMNSTFKKLLNPLGAAYDLYNSFFGKEDESKGVQQNGGNASLGNIYKKNGIAPLSFLGGNQPQPTGDPILKNMLAESKGQNKTLDKLNGKTNRSSTFNTTDGSSALASNTTNRLNTGIESIVAGGKQVRNLAVTVQKMVGVETLNNTAAEAAQDIEEVLTRLLVKVIQGSEVSLNRG